MKYINVGIDLGTTNSAIATYSKGKVIIHKNPINLKETLPSAVAIRKKNIVGDKALSLLQTQPGSVHLNFKRLMGTYDEKAQKKIDPIQLSQAVLEELFLFREEDTNSAVVTIPASFDTIQSNATKKAAYQSGLKEVVLLQEPIAACIAYANSEDSQFSENDKWLVYDYGGGTFDVALVQMRNGILDVIDHEGDNYMGGKDIDQDIVRDLICKPIEDETGKKKLYEQLVQKTDASALSAFITYAEEAKKILSRQDSYTFEVYNNLLDIDTEITITKGNIDKIICNHFDRSYQLIEKLLEKNNLSFESINRIVLVGGTTYIPTIREQLKLRSQCYVDTTMDPTTAIVVGAAYYAGSVESILNQEISHSIKVNKEKEQIDLKLVYETQSKDAEEIILGKTDSKKAKFYQIKGEEGFDSGLKEFSYRFSSVVPLEKKIENKFIVQLFDKKQQPIGESREVKISQGLFRINGQPLPADISIELDGDNGETLLEPIFFKNKILPLKRTIYKKASKSIVKNSDDKLIINILEGPSRNSAASNLTIGYLEIKSEKMNQDLIAGLDIQLDFQISESRDLTINIRIPSIEYSDFQIFTPSKNPINYDKVIGEIKFYIDRVNEEIHEEETAENRKSVLAQLRQIQTQLINLYGLSIENRNDIQTDFIYKIDDQKRNLIQKFDQLLNHRNILEELEYLKEVKFAFIQNAEFADIKQKAQFEEFLNKEYEIINSNNKNLIKAKAIELEQLSKDAFSNNPQRYKDIFFNLILTVPRSDIKDAKRWEDLSLKGRQASKDDSLTELKHIISEMLSICNIPKQSVSAINNKSLGIE
ncbi:Hsp70 family protein [Luteirhabdus pelagi]|uniref:Hsp70 family protein n=1 Tax=Luteirhabdus pelagi TaxID=2792783 RepID=UPI001939B9F0|nr:Hsp70 family protein [Luteirhabdus pelagi]